jgi:hypothetical protein
MLAVIGTGAGCLTLFAVFQWLHIFAKTRAVLAFAGVCLLVGGLIGKLLTGAATWVADLSNTASTILFGVSGGITLVALVLVVIFIHDLHPKHQASARTSFIGIALAALLVAGVSGATAFNNIPGAVQQGVTNAKTVLGG